MPDTCISSSTNTSEHCMYWYKRSSKQQELYLETTNCSHDAMHAAKGQLSACVGMRCQPTTVASTPHGRKTLYLFPSATENGAFVQQGNPSDCHKKKSMSICMKSHGLSLGFTGVSSETEVRVPPCSRQTTSHESSEQHNLPLNNFLFPPP